MNVRVRFAPSPTGFLHIGGARTALFNWLYARHTGGTFILRIEDTDTARSTQQATQVILDGLKWLGIDWDEGPTSWDPDLPSNGQYGPYFQSRRMHIYKKYVNMLLNKNLAYEHNGAIKFRMTKEPITIHDIIVGNVVRELTDREQLDPDFVIVRADGQPVFHLTNVVDDLEMAITHVIRGEDHLSNTSKHIALFNAFGAEPPKYAHIPLILNPDGSKMSKRDQGASILYYQEGGFLPEAVVNYLLLLGWSPKDDRQILPIQEVIQIFDLPQILRHNARFDHKKLLWMNYEYIRKLPLERFVEFAVPAFQKIGLDLNKFDKNYVLRALETCKEKIKTFNELPSFADFYFLDQLQFPDDAVKKEFTNENLLRLKTLADALALLADFTPDKIEITLKTTAEKLAVKPAALVHPLRLACTGRSFGPSLYHLMSVLGKEKVLSRVNHVIEKFYQTK